MSRSWNRASAVPSVKPEPQAALSSSAAAGPPQGQATAPSGGAAPVAQRGQHSSPNYALSGTLPALVLRCIGLLDAAALDLESRRDEAAFHRPWLADDDQAVHLLVRIEPGVDLAQVRLQRALQRIARALQAFGRQH